MEQASDKKKTKQRESSTVSDSSYGSMITGTSSSSSISLSLFSESDLVEAPSTSGYSSEMATTMRSKERKKERAKEFMRKLKSMLPHKKNVGKMDTLSTLEQLVDSMRQLSENEKKTIEFKTPPPHAGSYHSGDSDKLDQSNMFISVSPKSHVIQKASATLMEHLGYPADWWKGRLLKDFLKKNDVNTVNGCLAQHSADDDWGENSESMANSSTGGSSYEGSKYFFARIRRFRKLGEGFNLQNIVSYCPFRMTVKSKAMDSSEPEDEGAGHHRRSLVIYCTPLTSDYLTAGGVPEQNKFSLRHSLFCNYTYTDPNAVGLLGFLPQDLNGMQIFDLYHPDNLPRLLEVHKKIMLSMGQPFKSDPMKLRTRNGCYVEVETEWSSFINPLSMRLEFIIAQHTVTKAPSSTDLFEDLMTRPEKLPRTAEDQKIQEKILNVLKKRIQNVFAEPCPVAKPVKTKAITTTTISTPVFVAAPAKDSDATAKSGTQSEKTKDETSSAESKSAVLDEKGISSIYNQLNYSHNIKRFLMSHPKSFSNVSDEDSIMMRDDSEDENINEEEELPLEIPVVKPPSCGSSTQVHVSEPGHVEDNSSVAPFGEETSNPPGEVVADSRHSLTEETLKKHTKMQERLYLQRISEEQQLVLNMHRRVRKTRNTSHKKRPRPKDAGEDMDFAKHPCTKGGVFRSSSNIFMQSFPVIKENELAPTAIEIDTVFDQLKAETGGTFTKSYVGQQTTPVSFHTFPQGYPASTQGSLGGPQQPSLHPVPISCIPTSMTPMVPTQGLVDMGAVRPRQNIQWPYYPQAGYTLLPQVMAGFYQPLLQPVPLNQGPLMQYPNRPVPTTMAQRVQDSPESGENGKLQGFEKKGNYCDNNQSSSMEDTTSSIMYLLDADSSTLEDSDNKHCVQAKAPAPSSAPGPGSCWMHNKVAMDPPWLCGINWNSDVKMRYQLPQPKMSSVLKMDEKIIKNTKQNELAQQNLEHLLEDVALPDFEFPLDEEADYIFFPGDEPLDESDMFGNKSIEMEMTETLSSLKTQMHNDGIEGPDKGGGGDDGGGEDTAEVDENGNKDDGQATPTMHDGSSSNSDEGHTPEVVWTLADENGDTPTKSNSEDEKVDSASTEKEEKKDTGVMIKAGVKGDSAEDAGDCGEIAMETDFCSRGPHASSSESSLVEKRGSSPKDGSLSGDECSGSDGGHKVETEDAQSSCSKESSDLTPSDLRSNEEAGSSLKESDSSLKLVKGGPSRSVAFPSSSTDQMVREEGIKTESLVADLEEVFQKLFVPLKVRLSHRMSPKATSSDVAKEEEGGTNAADVESKKCVKGPLQKEPFWLLEAHMSNRVAMSYKIPTRPLEDVLLEDSRRMTDLVQSATVRQQLLQLLSEVNGKPGANTSPQILSSSNSASLVSSPVRNPPLDPSANDSIPLLTVSPTVQSPPLQTDIQLYTNPDYACFTAKKQSAETCSAESQDKSKSSHFFKDFSHSRKADVFSRSPPPSTEEHMNPSENSLEESKSVKFLAMRSNVSMDSMPSASTRGEDSSPSPHLYREMVFSDTNSEPTGERPAQTPVFMGRQSSPNDTTNDSAGNDSTGAGARQSRPSYTSVQVKDKPRQRPAPVTNLSKIDTSLNEKFQAYESSCLGEQGIEDVIMSEVFLSSDSISSGVGNRTSPDLQGNIPIMDE